MKKDKPLPPIPLSPEQALAAAMNTPLPGKMKKAAKKKASRKRA